MYSLRSRKSHPVYAAWSQSLSGNSSLLQQCHDISISMNLPRCTVWLKTGKAIVGSLLWQYSILDFSKSSIRMTSHKTFFVSGAVAGCQFEVVRKGWLWIIPVLKPHAKKHTSSLVPRSQTVNQVAFYQRSPMSNYSRHMQTWEDKIL